MLRQVKVYFDEGAQITTEMAAHLTDSEINEYYKVGRIFNVGCLSKEDSMQAVKSVEILK